MCEKGAVFFMSGLLTSVGLCLMVFLGWGLAYQAVGKECEMSGSFYVASTAYECSPKKGQK